VVIGRHCVHFIHSLLKRPATLDLSMDVSCFGLKMCSIFCVPSERRRERDIEMVNETEMKEAELRSGVNTGRRDREDRR
jgi:hypothetical protein